MRCSPAGMIASSLEEAEDLGQRTAEVTHNPPEGIKAARVTAGLVYLGREGRSMDALRAYAGAVYEIPTCDAIRSWDEFDETCQGTIPAVFAAFFDSTGFEDAIRNAISVGGDSDTIAAITGSIAEGQPPFCFSQKTKFWFKQNKNFRFKYFDHIDTTEGRRWRGQRPPQPAWPGRRIGSAPPPACAYYNGHAGRTKRHRHFKRRCLLCSVCRKSW